MLVCTCVSGIAGAKCVVRLGVGGGTIKMFFPYGCPCIVHNGILKFV